MADQEKSDEEESGRSSASSTVKEVTEQGAMTSRTASPEDGGTVPEDNDQPPQDDQPPLNEQISQDDQQPQDVEVEETKEISGKETEDETPQGEIAKEETTKEDGDAEDKKEEEKSKDATQIGSDDEFSDESETITLKSVVPAGQSDSQAAANTASDYTTGVADDDIVVAEEVVSDVVEVLIPEDFFYEKEEFLSSAEVEEDSGLPPDLLSLQHSFGYECLKRANLQVIDANTIIYSAGNIVQFVNLLTKDHTYLRTTSGGGIGAIAVHPSKSFIAIAENGDAPNINLYAYPSLQLYRILRGGTENYYSYVDFSPDGKLLASQGGESDYMLTVWNWRQEKIMLRCKAFSQDVHRVTFSTELEGQLTTAGTGHIRFWKMAFTFTGLKLQGALGKFGRTEISDIEGYVELPDGKVLSGSEWGNILVWDGGLIKVEISRKGKKCCHDGSIQQILLDEGELMTVGIDGIIRVWDFETIDTAESVDERGLYEMEPMNELIVDNVALRCIEKSHDPDNEPTIWYAQDANGGIWKLDLSFSHTSQSPEKLLAFHSGSITAVDNSPVSHLIGTTGVDGTVRVYDYIACKQICEERYKTPGTSLIWLPALVDPKGASLIVGFSDGVVRHLKLSSIDPASQSKKERRECELVLHQSFKPHVSNVTCMAVNAEGSLLVTGSDDNTLFFMTVGYTYEPVGFTKFPAAIRKVVFSPERFDKQTILVVCDEGMIYELDIPDCDSMDTTKSYEIMGLNRRSFRMTSMKSSIRHDEEMAIKLQEEEELKKKKEEERRLRIERGLETESDEESEEEEKEEEEPWEPYIPKEPSPILDAFYSDEPGHFWLSLGDYDSGYMYECEFSGEGIPESVIPTVTQKPLTHVKLLGSNDVPITKVRFSDDGAHVLMGMKNGCIRIQEMPTGSSTSFRTSDLAKMGPYWQMNMHDNKEGHVTAIAMSFDEQYLVTAGADGNLFLYSLMSQKDIQEKMALTKAKIPSAKKPTDFVADDIDDPGAYSIEEAKQKTEFDKMIFLAEQKKTGVRREIAKLRRQFKSLLEQNETLPAHLQLQRQAFQMDKQIQVQLAQQTEGKIKQVRLEMAWEAEKHRIALEKLQQKFKDVVECDLIIVKAFQTPHKITTFRAAKLSDEFYAVKAMLQKKRLLFSDKSRDATKLNLGGQSKLLDTARSSGEILAQPDQKATTTLKGSMGERITAALNKVDEKKKKRSLRKNEWDELYKSEPDDNWEDPADVAAIKEAQENMGDYKLKTADDYVVPDHLRMNVDKAKNRLMELKEQVHNHKYQFNAKILALRDDKIHIIDEIRELVRELKKIQARLGASLSKPIPDVPEMQPEEVPERKLEYTRDDLVKFKKDVELKAKAEQTAVSGGTGFGFSAPTQKISLLRAKSPRSIKEEKALSRVISLESVDVSKMSPLEHRIHEAELIKLRYAQDNIIKRISEIVAKFDIELRLLRHEKFRMDIVLKNADLRHVTLFEELMLLREFEKSENVLAEKVEQKENEKLDMQNKVAECKMKIDSKKKEIDKIVGDEKAHNKKFLDSLGENNKFAEYLTKVFKKRIKRAKKKSADEDSDEDSDDESDDDSDLDESDEESEEEGVGYDLDVCPSGCDQALYDNTCVLREFRLDIEEKLTEEKKVLDALRKETEGLQKKTKVIDAALQAAENNLEAFQLEKQRKLNELDVVVTLHLHQIQYVQNGCLPQDLSPTLVFEAPGIVHLQQRIKELEHEKTEQRKQMKAASRNKKQLEVDKKLMQQRVTAMEEECNTMMKAKFGCIVDMEKLETITVNRTIEELKEKLRVLELNCSAELHAWDEKINDKKVQIASRVRDNTERIKQLTMLLEEKRSLETSLDGRQKVLGRDYQGESKSDIRERRRLIQLVQLQSHEVEALKEEINLLCHKGGHILPPTQPPMPSTTTNMTSIGL